MTDHLRTESDQAIVNEFCDILRAACAEGGAGGLIIRDISFAGRHIHADVKFGKGGRQYECSVSAPVKRLHKATLRNARPTGKRSLY